MSAKRVLLVLFGLFTMAALALGTAIFVILPRWVESEVVSRARALGVVIEAGDVGFGWGWVQLADAKVSLVGVRGLTAKIQVIDVELDGTEPKRFTLSQASVEATGDLASLSNHVDVWRAAHERELTVPVLVKPLTLRVQRDPKSAPELVAEGGELELSPGKVRASFGNVRAFGRALGATRLAQNKERVEIGMTLGQSSLDNPVLSLERTEGATKAVHLAVSPVALGKLGAALDLPLPVPEAVLSGSLDATFPPSSMPLARLGGRSDFTLKGYIPPHPVELDGFVFGDTTTFASRFTLEPELFRVSLSDVVVTAGRFELKGAGELRLEGDQLRLRLSLGGSLPCAALAGVAAETRLGKALGRLGGRAARIALGGSVGVRVAVDANAAELDKARALRTITPGCGLKPLTLAELVALGELLPQALDPQVARDIEKLLRGPPPTLPNLGPDTVLNMPTLNGLPVLPGFAVPSAAPKPAKATATATATTTTTARTSAGRK